MWTLWLMLVLCHCRYFCLSASHPENFVTLEQVQSLLRNVDIKYDTAMTSMQQEIDGLKNDKLRLETEIRRLQAITKTETETTTETTPTDNEPNVLEDADAGLRNAEMLIARSVRSILKLDGVSLEENMTGPKRYLLGNSQTVGFLGVAFSVTLSMDIVNIRPNQPVHFNKVISNHGNGYVVSAATFRVPVSGWYAFSLTLMSKPNETQKLVVVKNGAAVFHCYAQGNEYNTASRTVVLHASNGEDIWVQTASESTFSTTVHGYEQTSFTGFILYAD